MRKIKKGEVVNAIYANFFGEDSAYIYPIGAVMKGLRDGSIETNMRYLPVTTASYNGWKWKKVIEIPTNLAWKYKLSDNQWNKIN